MIIFTKEIFEGAKNGITIWFEKVVPTLLPFMISTQCLIRSNFPAVLGRFIQPLTLRLFNLTGVQAFPLLIGLTAGYPMGIKTTAQLYKEKAITRSAAHRLMMCCNNAGTLFILGTVGTAFFKSTKTGIFIVICCYSAALLVAVLSGLCVPPQKAVKTSVKLNDFTQKTFASALSDSINAILMIGGYITVFSVISSIFAALHIFDGIALMLAPLGLEQRLNSAISIGILEITNGCALAAIPGKNAVVTAAVLTGWGGLSVHAQSLEFTEGTDLDCRFYFAGKIMTALLSGVLAASCYGIVY